MLDRFHSESAESSQLDFQGAADFHLDEMIICPNHTGIYSWCGFSLFSWQGSSSISIHWLSQHPIDS